MSKKLQNVEPSGREESFEIIEAAIDNIDLLTRAFDLITEVCDEFGRTEIDLDADRPRLLMH